MKKLLTLLLLLPTITFAGLKTIEIGKANSINFNQAFTPSFVAQKQIEAIAKCAVNMSSEIYITLYTPGGSISAGQLFFDTLNALPCTFHTITIFSASMGYQTVQNLGKRYILPSGTLMSHRASISGLEGELGGELDSIMDYLKANVKEMEIVASKRVGISLEKYRKDIHDELWMTAEQAVKTNHADEEVLVKCDETLGGTFEQQYNTFFGPVLVEFSECPIIVAPLNVKAANQSIIDKYTNSRNNFKKNVKTSL